MDDTLVALGLSVYAGNGTLLRFEELIRKYNPRTSEEWNRVFDLLREERRNRP